MRIIKDPISLVRVAHGLVYNPNFVSSGVVRKYHRESLAIMKIIIKQIPRHIKENI